MESLSIVLLAYHEADNLKVFIPRIFESISSIDADTEILVIDSAQPTDDTESICAAFGIGYHSQEEPGYGGAFRTGVKYAIKQRVCYLDVDGSHEPETIPLLYAKAVSGYDLVIGSRYVKGGTTNDKKTSILMSKLLNLSYRICLGLKARDISTSFRIYKGEQLKRIPLRCPNFDICEEVVFMLKSYNDKFRIAEVPIHFNKRLYGESKRNLLPFIITFIGTLFRLLGLRLKYVFARPYKKGAL